MSNILRKCVSLFTHISNGKIVKWVIEGSPRTCTGMIIWANKTWRALRQVVVFKIQKLIKEIPYKRRKDPVSIQAKFKTLISDFEMSKDPKIHYTLLSCMIFLGKKKSYKSILRAIAPDK